MTEKAIPEMSVDTRLLYQRVREMKHEEIVTYTELSALVGRTVTTAARHNLHSARNKALRHDRVVTEAVVGVGVKRLADASIVEHTGDAVRRRMRRAAWKGVQKLTSVDFEGLDQAQRVKQNAELSQLSALRAFSKDSITGKIERRIGNASSPEPLALAKTLDVFRD